MNWLGDKIDRSAGEGLFDRIFIIESSNHQHRGLDTTLVTIDLLNLLAAGESVHVGHDRIDQNNIRMHFTEHGQAVFPVHGFNHLVAFLLHRLAQANSHYLVIVCHQNKGWVMGGEGHGW